MNAFMAAQRDVVIPVSKRTSEYGKWCEEVLNYIDDRIDEALERADKAQGLDSKQVRIVDELLKATQDRHTLKYLVLSIFSPAHDTVAITIANAIFHLARKPECWAKLRAEIMPTASQPLTYGLLNSFKYLTWVLRESQYFLQPRHTCNANSLFQLIESRRSTQEHCANACRLQFFQSAAGKTGGALFSWRKAI